MFAHHVCPFMGSTQQERTSTIHQTSNLCLLVDPVERVGLVLLDLALLEPQGNLLLGVLNAVGAVADIAADVDGVVTTDGAGGGSQRVGGAEEDCCCVELAIAPFVFNPLDTEREVVTWDCTYHGQS